MNRLNFSDLKKGMIVTDKKGNIGTIKKLKDIHNITVNFQTGTGGYGFYCLDPQDKMYYEPLYKYEKDEAV